jgi:hypothetical protein
MTTPDFIKNYPEDQGNQKENKAYQKFKYLILNNFLMPKQWLEHALLHAAWLDK